MSLNLNFRLKPLALYLVYLTSSHYKEVIVYSWQDECRIQGPCRIIENSLVQAYTHINAYIQKDIVWKCSNVCQPLCPHFRWNHPLLWCKLLYHVCTHLSLPRCLWCHQGAYVFVVLVWPFWRPLCGKKLCKFPVNTNCSLYCRNNEGQFPLESHFSFLIASVPCYHFTSQIPSITRQRQQSCGYFQALCDSQPANAPADCSIDCC